MAARLRKIKLLWATNKHSSISRIFPPSTQLTFTQAYCRIAAPSTSGRVDWSQTGCSNYTSIYKLKSGRVPFGGGLRIEGKDQMNASFWGFQLLSIRILDSGQQLQLEPLCGWPVPVLQSPWDVNWGANRGPSKGFPRQICAFSPSWILIMAYSINTIIEKNFLPKIWSPQWNKWDQSSIAFNYLIPTYSLRYHRVSSAQSPPLYHHHHHPNIFGNITRFNCSSFYNHFNRSTRILSAFLAHQHELGEPTAIIETRVSQFKL